MTKNISKILDEKLCKCQKQYLSYWPNGKKPIFYKNVSDFNSKQEFTAAQKEFMHETLLMCPKCKNTITRREYNKIVEKYILTKKKRENNK